MHVTIRWVLCKYYKTFLVMKIKDYVWNVGKKIPEFVSEFDAFASLLHSKQPEWQMFHSICHTAVSLFHKHVYVHYVHSTTHMYNFDIWPVIFLALNYWNLIMKIATILRYNEKQYQLTGQAKSNLNWIGLINPNCWELFVVKSTLLWPKTGVTTSPKVHFDAVSIVAW